MKTATLLLIALLLAGCAAQIDDRPTGRSWPLDVIRGAQERGGHDG